MSFLTKPLFVISGPCVIESRELCLTVAERLAKVCAEAGIGYCFKASFDKANRTSVGSYRGPGLDEGLKILAETKRELNLPVLTDVHEASQASAVGEVADVLQVPAFLARQTDLLAACGATGKIVNVKKGQFMSPAEMKTAVQKVRSAGDGEVLVTERGTFFGYGRLVNDFAGLPAMAATGCPTVFDATHSTQKPAGEGTRSGGDPTLAPLLARAAVAAGYDGVFVECHPDPASALSDATSMMRLDDVPDLLRALKRIAEVR
ncbi:MAG: 3-deoxy-8-phosphooctulonate synthase [Phycisphaerae bacterium]